MVIDNETFLALESKNPLIRRQAINKLAQEGDELAIKALAKVYKTDPLPELRTAAKFAAKMIRDRLNAPPPAAVSSPRVVLPDDPNMPISTALKGGIKTAKRTAEQQLNRRLWFALITLTIVGMGVGVLVFNLGRLILSSYQQQEVLLRLDDAVPFDAAAGQALDGRLYVGQTSQGGRFFVSTPARPMPAQGVTVIVALTTGQPTDALRFMNAQVTAAGYVLVAPAAIMLNDDMINVEATVAHLNEVVRALRSVYNVHAGSFTLYGSGAGAEVAALYVARFMRDFAVVSLANGRGYTPPALDSGARYIVLAGEQDSALAEAAIRYKAALDGLMKPVLAFEVIKEAGAGDLPRQLLITLAQLRSLVPAP
ncbi:MAG: hypothetical protein SNJ54_00925 [Anaerolineae bacterium]